MQQGRGCTSHLTGLTLIRHDTHPRKKGWQMQPESHGFIDSLAHGVSHTHPQTVCKREYAADTRCENAYMQQDIISLQRDIMGPFAKCAVNIKKWHDIFHFVIIFLYFSAGWDRAREAERFWSNALPGPHATPRRSHCHLQWYQTLTASSFITWFVLGMSRDVLNLICSFLPNCSRHCVCVRLSSSRNV